MLRALAISAAALCIALPGPAHAFRRAPFHLRQALDDAEAVVVAQLVGEFRKREYVRGDTRGYEFGGALQVTRVLRGECPTRVEVILQHGLWPSIHETDQGLVVPRGPAQPAAAGPPTERPIHDSGSSAMSFEPIIDARQPAIWILAHYKDETNRSGAPTEKLSVREPGHTQPIAMLPLIEAMLSGAGEDEIVPFLQDGDVAVRRAALRHLTEADARGAFPAVADLLLDPDDLLRYEAAGTCVRLGGERAIPYLRGAVGDDAPGQPVRAEVLGALARLRDAGSMPRMLELLGSSLNGASRGAAASALGQMDDMSAMPALVAALKDDGAFASGGDEVWRTAQYAIHSLTSCWLSPNGDRAAQWWAEAGTMAPEAWKHFAAAEVVRSLERVGPYRQDGASRDLRDLGFEPPAASALTLGHEDANDPVAKQRTWRAWLDRQGWNDHLELPTQVDSELSLSVSLTGRAPLSQVAIAYTVTNVGPNPVWLYAAPTELLAIRTVTSHEGGERSPPPDRNIEPTDFVALQPGQSHVFQGRDPIWGAPGAVAYHQPREITAGLRFTHKGASCGIDAWVGEVWSEMVRLGE